MLKMSSISDLKRPTAPKLLDKSTVSSVTVLIHSKELTITAKWVDVMRANLNATATLEKRHPINQFLKGVIKVTPKSVLQSGRYNFKLILYWSQ